MNTALLALAIGLATLPAAAAAENVVTYHKSLTRHGAYTMPDLTLSAAANMQLDTGFRGMVTGHVYAQPLFWKNGAVGKGLVIAATESNNVYALDSATGAIAWQKHLGEPVALSQRPCGNIDPVGITGTPVIDPAAAVLYLDVLAKSGSGPKHLIYALSLADGATVSGWPIDVKAGIEALGKSFSNSTQQERSALQLFGGALYVNYGGNWGDCGSYRGTVIQLQTAPPKVVAEWHTRANGGGIWAQGGLAGDGASLFATTGNTFNATKWSDGEAIIRLKPGLIHSTDTRDYFTPSNWQTLDNDDADLGGTEALPLDIAVTGAAPARRVIALGKDGNAYLADRSNLGGAGGQLATMRVSGSEIITAPAVYQTQNVTMLVFTNAGGGKCSGSSLTMLNIAASGTSPISYAWCAALNGAGSPIVTTTDGTSNAIVWVVGAEGDNLLHGFNALTGQVVFGGGTAAMTGLHHFVTPIAAEHRLYIGADDRIYAFSHP